MTHQLKTLGKGSIITMDAGVITNGGVVTNPNEEAFAEPNGLPEPPSHPVAAVSEREPEERSGVVTVPEKQVVAAKDFIAVDPITGLASAVAFMLSPSSFRDYVHHSVLSGPSSVSALWCQAQADGNADA